MGAKSELFARWLQGNLVIADQAQGVGNRWWVDVNTATPGGGASPDKPLATLAAAIAAAGIGDKIYVLSNLAEGGLTLATAGVEIIGVGGDARPSGTPCADPGMITWAEAAAGNTLLTITAVGCRVRNIKFRVPTTGGTAIALSGAWHTTIENCIFQGRSGSYYAIDTDGNNANVIVRGCRFYYNNTAVYGTAIYGHGYTVGLNSNWLIENCIFHSNLRHILCRFKQSVIRNCQFAAIGLGADGSELTATTLINLSGAGSNWNLVTGCQLAGTYSIVGLYIPSTNDNWFGNFTSAGVSAANPA
jgi:hypothetical protein